MRHALVIAACVFMAALSVAVAAEPVAVHVFTVHDQTGLTDDATTERVKAVDDIKKRLTKNTAVRLVDDPAAAKVVIEVTSAGQEEGTQQTVATTSVVAGVAVTHPSSKLPAYVGRATISSGTFKTNIDASIGPFNRTYGENLARKFEDWLKKNAAALSK